MHAFELAAEIGADGIELDVHLSRDGIPVVIHDFTVDSTTDGSGSVRGKTLAELRELDAGRHFSEAFAGVRIPTLDEVFEAVGRRLLINVELKTRGIIQPGLLCAVNECVKAHGLMGRVWISSFNPVALRRLRRLNAHLPVGYLYTSGPSSTALSRWLACALIGVHQAHHPHFSIVDRRYMVWARRHGYRVNVWTVNNVANIRQMRDVGVDMIISDVPDLVRDVLQGEL